MTDFYITLPSNVKNNYFTNTVANYKTKLAQRVHLDDNWVVGLASISYTKSWNIKVEKAIIGIHYWSNARRKTANEHVEFDISDYDNIDDLLEEINKQLKKIEKSYSFKFPSIIKNVITNRIEIHLTTIETSLVIPYISDNLCRILGINKKEFDYFRYKTFKRYEGEFWNFLDPSLWDTDPNAQYWPKHAPTANEKIWHAEEPFDIESGFSSLYLYSDIVKHSIFGDSFSQLLRIVEVPSYSKFRDQIQFNYTDIHYSPLLMRDFETIEIHLKDENGDTIPFLFGRTIVTLHFKKINNN